MESDHDLHHQQGVSYQGSQYVSLHNANVGQTPSTATAYWSLLANGLVTMVDFFRRYGDGDSDHRPRSVLHGLELLAEHGLYAEQR